MSDQLESGLSGQVRMIIGISMGAVCGALLRYVLGLGIAGAFQSEWPWEYFLINSGGCFMAGSLFHLKKHSFMQRNPHISHGVFVGVLGSLTTFSSFEYSSVKLLGAHHLLQDVLFWGGSLGAGFSAYLLGEFLVDRIRLLRARSAVTQ